jgi:MEMO1 family protein
MHRGTATGPIRPPAVAGSFYPSDPERLRTLVSWLMGEARRRYPLPADLGEPLGILVPHAGLEYSGVVAAAGWLGASRRLAPSPAAGSATVIILGTNHRAGWLDGVAAWDRGAWRTPHGDVAVDEALAGAILGLGSPFIVDRGAHLEEHSIEVQLPLLRAVAPEARIVPLAVSAGTGQRAVDAGTRLGELLRARSDAGERIGIAISTDMAHYPEHEVAMRVTSQLRAPILEIDAAALADHEAALRGAGAPGLACGMCGVEPAVVGLAALRAAGVLRGVPLASATSADAGGPRDRTVGYFAAAFGR